MTSTKIAVVGATGRAGRHVVDVVRERGHEVAPIARSLGVDAITGEGLDEALTGATHIIDVVTGPSPVQAEATAFFTTAARSLAAAGERAGVGRIVVVSIIGTDRFSAGYGVAKVAHERVWAEGPIPVRVLRASQFHEFVGQLLQWGREGDVAHVPPMRTQLVAARTVAEAAVDLALDDAPAGGPIWEVAGPREERLVEMARVLAAHDGDDIRVEERTNPSDPDSALNVAGALLPGPDARLAGPTYAEWLAAQPAVSKR